MEEPECQHAPPPHTHTGHPCGLQATEARSSWVGLLLRGHSPCLHCGCKSVGNGNPTETENGAGLPVAAWPWLMVTCAEGPGSCPETPAHSHTLLTKARSTPNSVLGPVGGEAKKAAKGQKEARRGCRDHEGSLCICPPVGSERMLSGGIP